MNKLVLFRHHIISHNIKYEYRTVHTMIYCITIKKAILPLHQRTISFCLF